MIEKKNYQNNNNKKKERKGKKRERNMRATQSIYHPFFVLDLILNKTALYQTLASLKIDYMSICGSFE